jgi:ABC-2 type transport system permease protein
MAVYEHTYRAYEGALTPPRTRFLIIPRYAYRHVLRSRFFIAYMILCAFMPISAATLIYLRHNATALDMLHLTVSQIQTALPIGANFFRFLMTFQGTLAALLALFMGPSLLSPDLANNGLALYFSRPFSRWEYLFGKFCILGILLSLVSWIPLMLLFFLQVSLEGTGWLSDNYGIGLAIFTTSALWILVLTLMTMAASVMIRRKALAIGAVVAYFFVSWAMSGTINLINQTTWGDIIDVTKACGRISLYLFGVELPGDYPIWRAWATVIVFCGACVWFLNRKVRAYQVVR